MSRPPAVIASAVVCAIGSVLVLLMGVVIVASPFFAPPTQPSLGFMVVVVGIGAFALAGLGIATSIGLYRLRPWARTSILVFSGIMTVMCLMILLMIAAVPLPPMEGVDARLVPTIHRVLLAIYGVPLIIGVWWLVQFNTRATKAAFAAQQPAEPGRIPLSIALIGWFNVIGGVFTLIGVLTRAPAFVAGFILTGWGAALVYTFFAAVSIYLGRGILRLDERARILTIVWFGLTMLHTAFIALSPAARARMREAQALMEGTQAGPPIDNAKLMAIVFAMSVVLFAAAVWPLVRHKALFEPRD